jgi:hypothetical protein
MEQVNLAEKIDKNERSIKELQEKLNRKIAEDERKSDNFMRLLS